MYTASTGIIPHGLQESPKNTFGLNLVYKIHQQNFDSTVQYSSFVCISIPCTSLVKQISFLHYL